MRENEEIARRSPEETLRELVREMRMRCEAEMIYSTPGES